jgi:hypothetical protein
MLLLRDPVTVNAQPLRLASDISAPDFQVRMLGSILEITICAQKRQAMPDTDLGDERVNGVGLHPFTTAMIA